MRNNIKLIILIVLIVTLVFVAFWGVKIGKFQISSVSQIEDKNIQLNEKIDKATDLTSVEYPATIDTLEDTYEQFEIQKAKYEEISGFTKGNKTKKYETKKYDIGYLWKIVGKYATANNLTISMEVNKTSGEDLFDLNFNVSGQYVNISQFILYIENNSDLNFRIYNFKMSGSSETVNASFVVKDVNIDSSTLTTVNTNDTLE